MFIVILFVVIAVVVLIVLSMINVRASGRNDLNGIEAGSRHNIEEPQIPADHDKAGQAEEEPADAIHSGANQDDEEAAKSSSIQTSVKEEIDTNMNDDAYRQALLNFSNKKQPEEQLEKKNMNDDAFRKALLSMTKKNDQP